MPSAATQTISVKLVRVSPTGTVDATWPLPACIDGLSTVTDTTHITVLASMSIGYGNEQCSRSWSNRLARIDASGLSVVLASPEPFGQGAPWRLAGP